MSSLHMLVLVSLLVAGLAVVAGLVLLAVRALALWRTFRRFRRRLDAELAMLNLRLGRTGERLEEAGRRAARLEEARSRLQDSLSTARLLIGAAGEAWALATRLRAVFAGK
jgi:hypothetical protein